MLDFSAYRPFPILTFLIRKMGLVRDPSQESSCDLRPPAQHGQRFPCILIPAAHCRQHHRLARSCHVISPRANMAAPRT